LNTNLTGEFCLLIVLVLLLPQRIKSEEAAVGGFNSPRISAPNKELQRGNGSALQRFWTEAKGNAPLVEKFANDEGLILVTFLWHGGSEISSVLLQGGPPPLRFFIETGRFEFQAQVFDHHRIRDVLEAKRYPVIYREYNGGHDYFNWRGSFGDALICLVGKG